MSETLFQWGTSGPYSQYIGMAVSDRGNGLPVQIGCTTGDPYSSTGTSWSVSDAEAVHRNLGKAIEAAKAAGLDKTN